MKPISRFLTRHIRIALDSNIFIYYLEENPVWVDAAGEIFTWLEREPHSAVTSTLTMTELLVQPYRAGNERLVNRYFGLLSQFPNLEWVAPDLHIADTAARLRALHNFRTPDALQLATALRSGATAFLTNDSALTRVEHLEVGVLGQLR
ncbi:MAG: hypothetical protein JWN34_1621 [Bryobacterales bacterium]|nr:hypothetical protein [Bryobacterales bacterium]